MGVIAEELVELLEPTVERLGYELSDLDVRVERERQLRRQIDALLDVEDTIPGHYNLEVSSPGLDRKLTKMEHFQRFTGETVKVRMRFPIAGRRRFRGKLLAADEQNIVVEVDGEAHTLPMATIDTARLVPAGIQAGRTGS